MAANLQESNIISAENTFINSIKIKLAFSSFKVKNLISVKDYVPRSLRSYVVYKFKCAGCNSVYIGETSRHLSTRVREHLFTDKNSNIFKHLKGSVVCKEACNDSCFKVLDSANTSFKFKIKEALHIQWERPDLNKQIQHYNFSLSF